MSGKKCIFAYAGWRNGLHLWKAFFAFVLRNEIAKIQTQTDERNMTLICFVYVGVQHVLYLFIPRRRGSTVYIHFWVRRLAMPVS